MKLTENMTNMLARIYRLTVTERHYDYTAADIHKATLKALITRGFVVVMPSRSVVVTDAGLAVLGVEQDKPAADEVAPIPAQTLREEYDGTAARFNPEVIAELHEQAAAVDEKRTIARAFLSTPTGVVLTWDEIQKGYLDAMAERDESRKLADQILNEDLPASREAERDRIAHNQAVRGTEYRERHLTKDLTGMVNYGSGDVDDLGRHVQTTASGHLISLPAPADEPRGLDIWLESGVILIGPQTGDRYRFLRWDGGWAVVRHEADGTEMRIARADVTAWSYLPKASAEGVAAAKRRVPWRETFVMHERTSQRYRVLGMDNILTGKLIISHDCGSPCSERECAISLDMLRRDYVACDENGNVQPLSRNSLSRRSAPVCAAGDQRPKAKPVHVRHRCGLQIYTFEGVQDDRVFIRCVDGVGGLFNVTYRDFVDHYRAVCEHGYGANDSCPSCDAAEDIAPMMYPNSGLDAIVQQRDKARKRLAELLDERKILAARNGQLLADHANVLAAWERMRCGLMWVLDALKARGADGSIGAAFAARQIEGVLQDGEL